MKNNANHKQIILPYEQFSPQSKHITNITNKLCTHHEQVSMKRYIEKKRRRTKEKKNKLK